MMRDFCEQSYVKLDNLEKMKKCLEKYNLPRLNHYKTDNVKKQITTKEVESIINNLPINRCLGWDAFTGEFYHTFKKELISIFRKYLKTRRGRDSSKLIL